MIGTSCAKKAGLGSENEMNWKKDEKIFYHE